MHVFQWLELPSLNPEQTNKERIAELVAVNGGDFEILRWGSVKPGGIYGRMGLTVEEAKEAMWMVGVLDGFSLSVEGKTDDLVTKMLETIWENKRKNPTSPLVIPTAKKLIVKD